MNNDFVYEEQKQLIEMWKNKYYEQKEEIERLNKLIDYKGIEDIPQYVSDLEVDNKQLKEENQLLNKNYNIINELEKCINERITKTKIEPIREKERNRILYNLNVIYNRLQELKGSGNND